MKRIILLCCAWLISMHCIVFSQDYDKNWLVGYSFNTFNDTPPLGLSLMVFENGDFKFKRLEDNQHIGLYYFFAYSCISDYEGKFLYYTNGCRVLNNSCKIMLNGDTINPGRVWDGHEGLYYPAPNSTMFLPHPEDKNIYYLFHKRVTFNDDPPDFADKLFLTIIDSNLDNELGGVTSKNQLIIQDTLNESQMAACRHANGRDWWIPIRHGVYNLYYMLLLDPNGIKIHHTQKIGLNGQGFGETFHGNAMFSPDGRKYSNCLRSDKVQLFDFDRCTGYFSNAQHIVPEDSMEYATSVCFSPDSRKLYFNDIYRIWQYDLEARNIHKSGQLIAVWDSFTYAECCPTAFFQMRLAPDSKIYMSTFGGSNIFLHRIRNPNRLGSACDFVQRDIELPNWHVGILPYFPNYRLGPVRGSVCDSLYQIKVEEDIQISPNPVMDRLLIKSTRDFPFTIGLDFQLFSMDGKLVSTYQLSNSTNVHELELSNLPSAIYIYKLIVDDQKILTGKLVKL